jgi:hypothetical protein
MAGRPQVTEEEKKEILSKLEPYLKSGLNISKSLSEAQVPSATFYKLMDRDESFREKINRARNFLSVLANNIAVRELMAISSRQAGNPSKNIKPKDLSNDDKKFLWQFLLTSNLTKGEYGERKKIDMFDPEAEIHKLKDMLDEEGTDEISHDD